MCLTSEFSNFNDFNFGVFHKTEENFVNCWSNCLHLTKSMTLIEKSSLWFVYFIDSSNYSIQFFAVPSIALSSYSFIFSHCKTLC